jgi:hypothetical protein
MRLVVAVVVVLAACGDGVGAPDATPPVDADVGLVRVRYRGALRENHPVFFQNADGSLVLATRTDLDGTANAYMAPGGYVTLVELSGNLRNIFTWAEVQPGDELLRDNGEADGLVPTTTLEIAVPIDPGAGLYQLQTSCGSENVSPAAGASLIIELGDCRGRADMLVYTVGGPALHYIYAEDVPAMNGDSITMSPPYSVMERSTVEVRNAGNTTSMSITQRLIGEGRSLFHPNSPPPFGSAFLPIVDGAGTVNFDMLLPPAGTILTQVTPNNGGSGVQYVARWERTRATTTVDFAQIALRPYATRPRYDPPAHAITWTEEPTGAVPNAVVAAFSWFRPEIGGNYQWQIFAPRGADPIVKLPVLPDAQFLPRENDSINPPFKLFSIAIDGGYPRIRTQLPTTFRTGDPWPAEGPSGDVVYQELGPEPFDPD